MLTVARDSSDIGVNYWNDMTTYTNKPAPVRGKRPVVLWLPDRFPPIVKKAFWGLGIVALTHLFSPFIPENNSSIAAGNLVSEFTSASHSLYLLEHARPHVRDLGAFAERVIDVSEDLDVPPDWIMAVMYAESRFDPGIANLQGSGATGLIQFMPGTASELGTSIDRLKRMEAVQQMEYVYLYLQTVRERYGDYESLTDLYLAILYPKARGQDYCYTLFARPTESYRQNKGLDKDRDGRVTVSDVDKHLKGLFPEAYILSNGDDVAIR